MTSPATGSPALETYSAIRAEVVKLPRPKSSSEREVAWLDHGKVLGVSRDEVGRVEIFISGPRLNIAFDNVKLNHAHDAWEGKAGQVVANRLLLPAEAPFDAVAAFLCTNLLDNDVLVDAQSGYSRSEPVISLVLEKARLRNELVIGLGGELLLMRAMLVRHAGHARQLVQSWQGHSPSSRDFQLAGVGVEVKTTRGSLSRHRVHGIRQVERGHAVGGGMETHLFLVSIGIVQADASQGNAWSLPGLVDHVAEDIRRSDLPTEERLELESRLLEQVAKYGGDGYDHGNLQHRALFGQTYSTAFARFYDITDPAIKVLRTSDLAPFSAIDSRSLEFTLELPAQVHGAINPIVGMNKGVDRLIDLAWPNF